MNKLKRLLWSDQLSLLIIIWLITPIVFILLVYFLAGDKCQFIVDRKIFLPDCFYNENCPVVNNIECPKFIKTQYFTLISLLLGLPIILFFGAIWNVIRVFILSKSDNNLYSLGLYFLFICAIS